MLTTDPDLLYTCTLLLHSPGVVASSAFLETQSLASEPQFSRGHFSDQQSYGGWSWRYGLNDGGWDKGGGYMSDTASVCGYTSDTGGYRGAHPPPPVHATNTSTGIR